MPLAVLEPPFAVQILAASKNDGNENLSHPPIRQEKIRQGKGKGPKSPELFVKNERVEVTRITTTNNSRSRTPVKAPDVLKTPKSILGTENGQPMAGPQTPVSKVRRQGGRGRTPQSSGRRNRPHFNEYLSSDAVKAGLEDGSLLKGSLRVNAKNPSECFVTVDEFERDVAIISRRKRNRALEGDVVALKLRPKEEWRSRRDRSSSPKKQQAPEPHNENNLADSMQDLEIDDIQPQGEVVAIIERREDALDNIIGHLRNSDGESGSISKGQMLQFIPVSRKMPHAIIPAVEWPPGIRSKDPMDAEVAWNSIYSAKIHPWSHMQRLPICSIRDCIGSAGHAEPETEALLRASEIHHREHFDDKVLESVAQFNGTEAQQALIEQEASKRRDMRKTRIFSIDPVGSIGFFIRRLFLSLLFRSLPGIWMMLCMFKSCLMALTKLVSTLRMFLSLFANILQLIWRLEKGVRLYILFRRSSRCFHLCFASPSAVLIQVTHPMVFVEFYHFPF